MRFSSPGFLGKERGCEPSALHAKLFEEGRSNDPGAVDESVRVQQRTADDRDENDGEAAAEDLRGIADDRPACHGAEIGDDLGDCDLVGGKAELVLKHGGVEILGAVRHEVEAGHEENLYGVSDGALLELKVGCCGTYHISE